MRKINRLFDKLLFIGTATCSISFFIIIIIAVASRYIFRMPILASIELSRLLFVWSCFLAAAIAYRRKAHVSITFIFDKMPQKIRNIITPVLSLLVIIFMIIVFYQSLLVTILLWQSKLPMLEISQSFFYLPVPIISIIIIFYTIEFLREEIALIKSE